MQYNRETRITSVNNVKEFFHHLVNERNLNFHPDDIFEDYVSCDDGSNTFSQDECAVYNRLMNESFDVCEKNGVDIYAIGVDTMQSA